MDNPVSKLSPNGKSVAGGITILLIGVALGDILTC